MTPTVHALLRSYSDPKARAAVHDPDGILPRLTDAHCFEMSAVVGMAKQLGSDLVNAGVAPQSRLAFLPAPVTVLDSGYTLKDSAGVPLQTRSADMLIETAGGRMADVYCLTAREHCHHATDAIVPVGRIWLQEDAEVSGYAIPVSPEEDLRRWEGSDPPRMAYASRKADIYAELALINTPRIIGRRQHMPHSGLQRRLAAALKMPGKYPLRAWSEIVLEVHAPEVARGEFEARLTGGKALHFCRAHLRVRNGKVEFVSAHWRGDPALGMKQTRYRVVPPR